MTDIPSRSFESVPRWHFTTEQQLLTFFNDNFPLPQQKLWMVYRPSIELGMCMIFVLRMRHSTLTGNHVGRIGLPMLQLWEWTLCYRESPSEQKADSSQDSLRESGRDTMDERPQSTLKQYVQLSRPLDRQLPWPTEKTLPKCWVWKSFSLICNNALAVWCLHGWAKILHR
jgi:hypothetical protein